VDFHLLTVDQHQQNQKIIAHLIKIQINQFIVETKVKLPVISNNIRISIQITIVNFYKTVKWSSGSQAIRTKSNFRKKIKAVWKKTLSNIKQDTNIMINIIIINIPKKQIISMNIAIKVNNTIINIDQCIYIY
jgi:hypothetical protein